jgi:hypothetical protein
MTFRLLRRSGPATGVASTFRTGKQQWIFHAIPREWEFGNETWKDGWADTQFAWLQGARNFLLQNSFWLRRPGTHRTHKPHASSGCSLTDNPKEPRFGCATSALTARGFEVLSRHRRARHCESLEAHHRQRYCVSRCVSRVELYIPHCQAVTLCLPWLSRLPLHAKQPSP